VEADDKAVSQTAAAPDDQAAASARRAPQALAQASAEDGSGHPVGSSGEDLVNAAAPIKLPANVYSPDHVRFCIEELEAYATMLRQRLRGGLSEAQPELSAESGALVASLPTAQRQDPLAIDGLVKGLQWVLEGAVTMTMTLAALAPHSLREELVAWMRDNVSPTTLIEFHVNPDIAGGMVLRTANRVYDWSFRGLLLKDPVRLTRALERV
jgi:hypothetical protein